MGFCNVCCNPIPVGKDCLGGLIGRNTSLCWKDVEVVYLGHCQGSQQQESDISWTDPFEASKLARDVKEL